MGANKFASVAKGKDADEAFRKAVEQAEYEYGHRGYTGTIAEKDDYVLVTDKTLSPEEAAALADKLMDDDDERVNDKWGPAGAIAVDDGSYYFFGWASS